MISAKTVVHILLTLSIVLGISWQAHAENLMGDEQIGPIRQGMTQSAVVSLIDGQAERGPSELWGADGMYHQTWTYRTAGIELGMVGEKPDSAKTVESVTINAPCLFATKRGIRIGSPENEVMTAYRLEFAEDDSIPGQTIVSGSVFDGLVFHLRDGKVDQIFLGASAE